MTDNVVPLSTVIDAARRLADALERQGLHVGFGEPAYCVTCHVRWPCADADPYTLPCMRDQDMTGT